MLTVEIRPGDRAVARIAGALRKLAEKSAPGQIALALPLALGDHIDHRVVHQAALEALAANAAPMAFYEDLPYAGRPGIADTIEHRATATGLGLEPSFAQQAITVVAEVCQRKHSIAECYDSQIDDEIAWQLATFAERYAGRERLWCNAAWFASALQAGEIDKPSEAAR